MQRARNEGFFFPSELIFVWFAFVFFNSRNFPRKKPPPGGWGKKIQVLHPSQQQKPFGNCAAGRAEPGAQDPRGEKRAQHLPLGGGSSSSPGSRCPTCSSESAGSLERGGGRRRHKRKFMARVTCFPLPQWGPVTLNRKLMREERNLIPPPPPRAPRDGSPRLRGGAGVGRQRGRLRWWLESPAPGLPPAFRSRPAGRGLREGSPASPGSPSPAGRRLSAARFHAPRRAAGGRAPPSLLLRGPGPRPSLCYPPPGGLHSTPASRIPRAELPAPTEPGTEARTLSTQPPPQASGARRANDHAGRPWGLGLRAPALLRPQRVSPGARPAPPGTDPAVPRP